MPFLDHLEELRWRILWSLLAIVIATGVSFGLVYKFHVMDLLVVPIRKAYGDPNLKLIYLSPSEPFFVMLKLSVYGGLILAFPIVLYQLWAFLSPALEKREKRAVIPALYLGTVLFCAGVAISYFAALPATLVFFKSFLTTSLQGNLEVNNTLGFIAKMLLAFGALFELPVVIMVLSAIGLVTPEFLRSKRRHAIVGIAILASVVTPGDAVTLTMMMMLPLVLLYELGIFLSVMIWKGKKEREAEYEASLESADSLDSAGVQEG
jgi:sec-independent protein translocase protein TatC